MRGQTWMQAYHDMTTDEKLSMYDQHNGATRFSNDLTQRLQGVCGCMYCAETRKLWTANVAPINDPSRKGSRAMGAINICDISGDLVNGGALGSVTVVTSGVPGKSETIHKEVCPVCIALIVELLETQTDAHSRKAHNKPWIRPKVEDNSAEESVRGIIRKVVEEVHREQREIEAPTTKVEDNARYGRSAYPTGYSEH
jgi:hypothetical protein